MTPLDTPRRHPQAADGHVDDIQALRALGLVALAPVVAAAAVIVAAAAVASWLATRPRLLAHVIVGVAGAGTVALALGDGLPDAGDIARHIATAAALAAVSPLWAAAHERARLARRRQPGRRHPVGQPRGVMVARAPVGALVAAGTIAVVLVTVLVWVVAR